MPRVSSADGTTIAVYDQGAREGPTIIAVHGYPDNHAVWGGVVAELADRYRMVSYDVRGAGESDVPSRRSDYRIERLVEDLVAVIDATSPDRPVHLLGHDWGSVQLWAALTDPRSAPRIASFTSISGPSLDHAGVWLRSASRHPRAAARQLLESSYIGLFQVPGLPEAFWRSKLADRLLTRAGGLRPGEPGQQPTRADKVHGLALYRANMVRLSRPKPTPTRIPVQVLAPRRDPFVSVALQTEAPAPFVANLRTRTLAGGHWVVRERPDVIARLVHEFVTEVGAGPATGQVATRTDRGGAYANKLVLVTGGARGIGRATALEFARQGADVIIADINDVAAKQAVADVANLGVDAVACHLDVSDPESWERVAAQVRAGHGVPDVVVNNAGIGMGGPFLATTVEDWNTILGTNLWSVIHGCRIFGAQMVERGEGGQILNIASAAAWAPSRIYPAYATTKAAVLMLSECLRAELGRDGIGVTAICPGFIDTDITQTTVHVGVDADTQQRLREHAVAAYRRRNYTPERVAKHAVRAARGNAAVAAITPEAKLLRVLARAAPALSRRLARVDLTKL